MKKSKWFIILFALLLNTCLKTMNDEKTAINPALKKKLLEIRAQNIHAPDFPADSKWLNTSSPLSLNKLKGKVVLLDFWTYCCINCMHIIPDLKYLEAKYAAEPLLVIGVHSAKFTNEKELENVREAVLRYEIEHPVVLDSDYHLWNAFGVRAWPTLALVDPEGYLIGMFSGEGNRELLDNAIQIVLEIFESENKLDFTPLPLALEKNNQPATLLSYPGKIEADPANNQLIISDSNHNRFLVIDENGHIVETMGSGAIGFKDGNFEEATFNHPQGMARYQGDLLVADTENHAIRRIDFSSRIVETIAGTGEQARQYNLAGPGKQTALNSPWDLYVQGDTCYIAMAGPHQIWALDLKTNQVAPYAGTGREARIDGPRQEAAFAQPSGITGDGENLYIADSEISSIRRIHLKTGKVSTLAGGDLFEFGDRDGVGEKVRLQHPLGVLFHEGILYIADTYNHKIKILNPTTLMTQSFLRRRRGFEDGAEPLFYEPSGLAYLNDHLYITDTNNHLIRKVNLTTKIVTTVTLTGLSKSDQAPTPHALATLPNTASIQLPLQRIQKNANITLAVKFDFPDNYKINADAPFQYLVKYDPDNDLNNIQDGIQKREHPVNPFEILFQTTDATSGGEIVLEMLYYYCEIKNANICLIRSVRFNIPFEVVQNGKTTINLVDTPLN